MGFSRLGGAGRSGTARGKMGRRRERWKRSKKARDRARARLVAVHVVHEVPQRGAAVLPQFVAERGSVAVGDHPEMARLGNEAQGGEFGSVHVGCYGGITRR